jgi:hypothetical protein
MERAEDIQYSNYGIGGQYEVQIHLDENGARSEPSRQNISDFGFDANEEKWPISSPL